MSAQSIVGNNAGICNTTGNNNFFAGRCSGAGNTTGNYNTFLGSGASGQYGAGQNSYLALTDTTNYVANTWHHVGFTWDNGSLKLYKNGNLARAGSIIYYPPSLTPSDLSVTINTFIIELLINDIIEVYWINGGGSYSINTGNTNGTIFQAMLLSS